MGGVNQPFLYSAERHDGRLPETTFDPKAVTRASWENKAPKPRPDGPLLSFNIHPEYVGEPAAACLVPSPLPQASCCS